MKIGVLTSGGDAPGMNAALYHLSAALKGVHELVYYQRGVVGLLENAVYPVTESLLRQTFRTGGSILSTSRLQDEQLEKRLAEHPFEVEALVVLGGDGSLKHLCRLLNRHVPVIGIPCTIDLDVAGTEETIGFDSACQFYLQTGDSIFLTGQALQGRIFLLETLGGPTGYLATAVGRMLGADAILIPEQGYDVERLAKRLERAVESKGYALAVCSEGVGTEDVVRALEARCSQRVRLCKPGHIARGCTASYRDVELGRLFAAAVMACLEAQQFGVALVIQNRQVQPLPFEQLAVLPPREIEVGLDVERSF